MNLDYNELYPARPDSNNGVVIDESVTTKLPKKPCEETQIMWINYWTKREKK